MDGNNPVFKKGGTKNLIENGYGNLVTFDQRSRRRPDEISLGSWDLPNFGAIQGRYTIPYEEGMNFENEYLIDLAEYITTYPEDKHADNISYEIISQPGNGTVRLGTDKRYAYFTPHTEVDGTPSAGIVGATYDMIYRVYTYIGTTLFETLVTLKIAIVDVNLPLGIVDQSVVECYTDMETTEFIAEMKFETGRINQPSRFDGYTIPLVGDLNGDGKPEIVVLGIAERTSQAGRRPADAYYLYIINGQTGEQIVKYSIPTFPIRGPYHNTPSFLALVDTDRDGMGEIIIAYGDTKNSTYQKRIVCYEVNENTFDPDMKITDQGKLTEKWISDERYDAHAGGYINPGARYNVTMPLVQVVDIDGDGQAEIIVYNKIYSALDGTLLVTLEDLGPSSNHYDGRNNAYDAYKDYAFTGRNRKAPASADTNINFTSVYDLDFDGKYEIIAGGKVYYDIDLQTKGYKVKSAENILYADGSGKQVSIGDGYTGVADINGDGKPEIVVTYHTSDTQIQIDVWDPGFVESDGNGGWSKVADPKYTSASLLARETVNYIRRGALQGAMSYVYIGDIDGKIQNDKKFPEISILGSRFYYNSTIPAHLNVGSGAFSGFSYTSSAYGALMSWTWDDDEQDVESRLKVSFLLEHADQSIDTGFTLFDFDNDGSQEICYRDEKTLRIISAIQPIVKLNTAASSTGAVRFSKEIRSWTGFEYPSIADIDGDGSADMIVMGSYRGSDTQGYIFAVQADPLQTSFAPAPKVWNQFMYHPLKINEDLITPLINLHPLKMQYVLEKDAGTQTKTAIYNANIMQAVVSAEFDGILKPIVATPDAVVKGKIEVENSRMVLSISNKGNVTLNGVTPIRFFKNEVSGSNLLTTLGGQTLPVSIGVDIFVGETLTLYIPLTTAELEQQYIVRVSDASETDRSGNLIDTFGTDGQLKDCNWADNVYTVGVFVLRDDPYTVMQYNTIEIDLFENDDFPEGFSPVLTEELITAVDTENNTGSWWISNNKFVYTAPGEYEKEVVEFKLAMTEIVEGKAFTDSSRIYLFILQSAEEDGLSVCKGDAYDVALKTSNWNPAFYWYNESQVFQEYAPSIPVVSRDYVFYARLGFHGTKSVLGAGETDYSRINFPMRRVMVRAVGDENEVVKVKWKGQIDSDWQNPANWVLIEDEDKEVPIEWIPSSCVDVIVSEEAQYYPDLRVVARTNDVVMENRAMIGKVHLLDYNQVTVDLTPAATEKERYVMWSAPLKEMYTGDYHFTNANGNPAWGDVHMNYFQAHNPDFTVSPGSVAKENAFTADFGGVGESLPLGKAFNIRILNQDTGATFRFPKTSASYTDANGKTYQTARNSADSYRFIVDGLMDQEGTLDLPVYDDPDYSMLQVVNPFMAYLNAQQFLEANADLIEGSYKI
ncbi:MAG: hypothetical protein LIP05_10565 [Tannerellaceae bacterium]|nr:hypothetical protein [Tannerellaceae bacterium]